MSRRLGFLCWLLTLPLATGCSSGPRTYKVTGAVTLDGKPVPMGDVLLVSDDGARGPDAAKIQDGRFELRSTAGKKRVEIRAHRQIGNGPMGPIYDDYLPADYNSGSTLTAEVSADRANHFAFNLARVRR